MSPSSWLSPSPPLPDDTLSPEAVPRRTRRQREKEEGEQAQREKEGEEGEEAQREEEEGGGTRPAAADGTAADGAAAAGCGHVLELEKRGVGPIPPHKKEEEDEPGV